jgi:ATP-dependent RNA helicase DeaD
MLDPVEIVVGKQNSVADNIEHRYYMMKERDRYHAIKRILDFYPEIYGLIFCRTRRETGQIADKLEKEGYSVVALHGDLSQAQRDAAMKKFREKTVKVLVATDVAARGIDVKDISHVIHYNLPDDIENYTHRSGRTARAGKSGKSLTLVNTRETYKIKQVQSLLQTKIKHSNIPSSEEICEKQMYALMDRVVSTPVDDEAIDLYWPVFYKKLKDLPAEEIVLKFISMELNAFLDYYKDSGDLNASHETGGSTRGRERQGGKGRPGGRESGAFNRNLGGSKKKFFISLGEKQNLNKGALLRLVCSETGIESNHMGRIDIHSRHAFFEVDDQVATKILPSIKEGTYEGKSFEVTYSQEKEHGKKKGKKKKG